MKKLLFIFIGVLCSTSVSWGAVTVKKAAPVATKKVDKVESATSLLPTVLNLYNGVTSLQAQQQQLNTECAATSDEVATVNDLIKEWAKMGDTDAISARSGLGANDCTGSYSTNIQVNGISGDSCYETFKSASDKGTIWYGFPKASYARVCDVNNNTNCQTVSNVYTIFNRIPLTQADYTKSESTRIARLIEKSQRCAPSKLNAAKMELYGGFLTQTLSGVGQSTGTAGTSSAIQAVSSMGGGGLKSALPSLSQMALQVLDK